MKTFPFESNSKVIYHSDFCTDIDCHDFASAMHWRNNSIRMFGKMHQEPRLTQWFGEAYQYSNIPWEKKPMPDLLHNLMLRIQAIDPFPFNSALCNLYRNGQDYMGWHRDNEREMDTRLIASVSLGATRAFKIRSRKTKEITTIELEHGSLLLMHNLQEDYEHCLPKRLKVDDQRLNITFRRIVNAQIDSE